MRFVLRDGARTFEFARSADLDDDVEEFRDSIAAERFLRRFRGDPSAMLKLRQLDAYASGPAFHRYSDDELIKLLAQKLAHRRILLVSGQRRRVQDVSGPGRLPDTAAPAARAAAPSAASAPTEASLFPANFDGVAQAAALKSASESGAPFCEECERARKAEQAA